MKIKQIFELFSGVHRRMSNIDRYNNTPRISRESVAEHSYFVSFYVMILSGLLKEINKEKVLQMALIHDLEESVSGDLPHTIKQEFKYICDAFDLLGLAIVKSIFLNEATFVDLWKEARDKISLESKLVACADALSAILYCREEIQMGNTFMQPIFQNQCSILKQIIDSEPKLDCLKEIYEYYNF